MMMSEARKHRLGIGQQLNKLAVSINTQDHPLSKTSATAAVDAIIRHAEALAAQVERLQALATAEAALSTALVDLLTDEQVNRPDYPTDLDREATRLGRICHEHGDLPDEEG